MDRITFGERLIASAGYDVLRGELVVEFTRTRQVCLYQDVTEEIWYGLKYAEYADRYFQKNIRGRYEERKL